MKTVSISPAVLDVLQRSTVDGNAVKLPAGQLERSLYEATDKVLKALGGKWNRAAGAHVFANGLGEQLEQALGAGFVVDRKKTLEIFETPAPLAAQMAAIAATVSDFIDRPIRVLEPSAGTGRLLDAFALNLEQDGADSVTAIDIDEANCAALLKLEGLPVDVLCGDFLELAPLLEPFDVILMNPPFSRNQDIAHVTAAVQLLAPGGVLVAIMSSHHTFATDKASIEFRELIADTRATVEAVLPGAFKAEGTNVATVLVTIRKEA